MTTAAKSTVVVRHARAADRDVLVVLWRELDNLHARLLPSLFRRGERRRPALPLPPEGDSAIFVACRAELVLGAVSVKVHNPASHEPTLRSARRGYVEDLVVHAAARRQGVGRELLAVARRFCKDRGAEQLMLTVWEGNREAEAFYRSLGFEPFSSVLGHDL